MTIDYAIKRIFMHEPDAIVSVAINGEMIAVLDKDSEMCEEKKWFCKTHECPLMLKRLDIPGLITSIIIDIKDSNGG